jgi:hypothetical protein
MKIAFIITKQLIKLHCKGIIIKNYHFKITVENQLPVAADPPPEKPPPPNPPPNPPHRNPPPENHHQTSSAYATALRGG